MPNKQLPETVLQFIAACAKEVGKSEEGTHDQRLWSACREEAMESPIEQMFYCAFRTVRALNRIEEEDMHYGPDGQEWPTGLGIWPQRQHGSYRVDFLCERAEWNQKLKQVIVECDSRAFHERSERERRYEKARDRYFARHGLHVFRFTGKELLEEPLRCAAEVISFLTGENIEDLALAADA